MSASPMPCLIRLCEAVRRKQELNPLRFGVLKDLFTVIMILLPESEFEDEV